MLFPLLLNRVNFREEYIILFSLSLHINIADTLILTEVIKLCSKLNNESCHMQGFNVKKKEEKFKLI